LDVQFNYSDYWTEDELVDLGEQKYWRNKGKRRDADEAGTLKTHGST
jgi:hypothetical protein